MRLSAATSALSRTLLIAGTSTLLATTAVAAPVKLRTEQMTNPAAIDVAKPVFSWQSDATSANWMQSAYEVLVSTDPSKLVPGKANIWDSGKITSSDSVNIPYAGPALTAQTHYFWAVQVTDKQGKTTHSTPAWFETGLLTPSAWHSQWIRRDDPAAAHELEAIRWLWLPNTDPKHVPSETAVEFRYPLHLDAKPMRASLHVLAHGNYTATVNGKTTGQHEEWSAFDWEEIGSLLKPGDNEILIKVTAPRLGDKQKAAGGPAGFAASLRITDADGAERRITSDKAWQTRPTTGEWQAAQEIGPLSLPLGLGTDRRSLVPGPNRVSTDASLLRKDFSLTGKVTSAKLTITAMGAYRAFINGKPVATHDLLNPGFTDFHKRVLYQTYDVTSLLTTGDNTVATILGSGWHGSPLTWSGSREYTDPDALRAQLDVTLADGSHKTIGTDETWQTAQAPVLFSEIYAGEVYDARLALTGWNAPHFTGKNWSPAVPATVSPEVTLTSQPDLSIAESNIIKPIAMDPANAAHPVVYDMGQNMVGNIVLHVHGPAGTAVQMRFAERLNPDGSMYTLNLRNATVTDTYVLSGKGDETYTPSFTFHGFRYVELAGYPGTPTTASIEGLVYNSLPQTPSIRFNSSSELLNSMGKLGIWGQRGNFVSVPTDCPQRDERLGWMGDAGVFWRTGTYNFDIGSFTHKFMFDMEDAQNDRGAFSDVSPNLLGPQSGAPGWADAGILVPYAAWLQYGDKSILERSWPQMEHFMDYLATTNPDFLRAKDLGNNYGDWLAPDTHTPRDLIATAYWAILARDMKEMALAIGQQQQADKYQALYDHIAEAYRKAYVQPDGTVTGNTQAAYVVTLYSGIAPESLRANMVDRLVKDIAAHDNHLTTGFLGTPFLMFVLDDNQRADIAYKLLLQDTYPSWGYMVRKGATTWWERWNGDTGDASMNSYNHYAFGSVMAWVFRRSAGIDTDPTGAGYHHLTVKPHFDGRLPQLHTEYDSAYGTVTTDWNRTTGKFTLTNPANTTATVTLPNGRTADVGSGTHTYTIN
ncbi:family 78 glycoside hydrolase catalytic domain [Granulicella sibirica]|uniref:alpha-L-rhamnosidase n=1 Tax=Granulicella sibirica TaxID=2479048 RepID=A0A4V1L5M7_9BACT|nr:family 78 glycoside hydrolase catalytic domain [Granulicella sibirica]RXH56304.1 Alfa-L-rhamnosidase [Granulicella sibirica]